MSKTTTILIVSGVIVTGVVAYFTFRKTSPVPTYRVTPSGPFYSPFGNGYDAAPPLGTSLPSQRNGPPTSPVPGTVGRVIQETQTGASAAAGIAKDLKTTIDSLRGLFS